MDVKHTAFSAVARTPHVLQAVMIALDPTQNAKLPRDMLLESCIQAPVLLACYERKKSNTRLSLINKQKQTMYHYFMIPSYKFGKSHWSPGDNSNFSH